MSDGRRRGRWVTEWLLLFALTACGSSPDPTPTDAATTGDQVSPASDREATFLAEVTLQATGELDITWSGKQELMLTRVGGPGLGANLLTIAATEYVSWATPTEGFRWGFDLLNAYDDQPLTMTMAPGAVGQGLRHIVMLEYLRTTGAPVGDVDDWVQVELLRSFNVLESPCTLAIGPEERTGQLACPHLADDTGKMISIDVSWNAPNPRPG